MLCLLFWIGNISPFWAFIALDNCFGSSNFEPSLATKKLFRENVPNQHYLMTHFDAELVTFDNCPKVRSMIAAQILAVVQNRIPQASTFCGYIYIFCFHGTCTMLYFVLRTKLMLFLFLHMFFTIWATNYVII